MCAWPPYRPTSKRFKEALENHEQPESGWFCYRTRVLNSYGKLVWYLIIFITPARRLSDGCCLSDFLQNNCEQMYLKFTRTYVVCRCWSLRRLCDVPVLLVDICSSTTNTNPCTKCFIFLSRSQQHSCLQSTILI